MKTYRKYIFIVLLMLLAVSAMAQGRLDLALDVPFYFGIQLEGESMGALSDFTFLFPEAGLHYVLGSGGFKIGLGVRMFTLILESIAWPNVFAELHLDPLVVSAQLGGGAFAVFGLYNDGITGPVVIGDIAAAYKFTDSFRAGIGAFLIGETDEEIMFSETGIIPYAIYAFGKFTIDF